MQENTRGRRSEGNVPIFIAFSFSIDESRITLSLSLSLSFARLLEFGLAFDFHFCIIRTWIVCMQSCVYYIPFLPVPQPSLCSLGRPASSMMILEATTRYKKLYYIRNQEKHTTEVSISSKDAVGMKERKRRRRIEELELFLRLLRKPSKLSHVCIKRERRRS